MSECTIEKLDRRIRTQKLILASGHARLARYEAQRAALAKTEDQPREEEKKKARS